MKGILFTEILFNKTINKQKTQTRREGKLKLINDNPDLYYFSGQVVAANYDYPWMPNLREVLVSQKGTGLIGMIRPNISLKPNYKLGEIVYLKEPYMIAFGEIKYKYSEYEGIGFFRDPSFPLKTIDKKWKNKLFMGSQYARYFIKITGIKAEKLFDISDEDCIKEGIESVNNDHMFPVYDSKGNVSQRISDPKKSYFSLFRYANNIAQKEILTNKWVFVYDYVLCNKEGEPI